MELTVRQAEELLIEWAAVVASRDSRILAARDAGVSKMRIHELTGVARTTVNRILSGHGPQEAVDGPGGI